MRKLLIAVGLVSVFLAAPVRTFAYEPAEDDIVIEYTVSDSDDMKVEPAIELKDFGRHENGLPYDIHNEENYIGKWVYQKFPEYGVGTLYERWYKDSDTGEYKCFKVVDRDIAGEQNLSERHRAARTLFNFHTEVEGVKVADDAKIIVWLKQYAVDDDTLDIRGARVHKASGYVYKVVIPVSDEDFFVRIAPDYMYRIVAVDQVGFKTDAATYPAEIYGLLRHRNPYAIDVWYSAYNEGEQDYMKGYRGEITDENAPGVDRFTNVPMSLEGKVDAFVPDIQIRDIVAQQNEKRWERSPEYDGTVKYPEYVPDGETFAPPATESAAETTGAVTDSSSVAVEQTTGKDFGNLTDETMTSAKEEEGSGFLSDTFLVVFAIIMIVAAIVSFVLLKKMGKKDNGT